MEKDKAIKIENVIWKSKRRKIYLFHCSGFECKNLVRVSSSVLKTHKGLCNSCGKLKPIEDSLLKGCIRKETLPKKGLLYIFHCQSCGTELRLRREHLKQSTKLCKKCFGIYTSPNVIPRNTTVRLRPYEALFRAFVRVQTGRKKTNSLTFDDFVTLMADDVCHYCGNIVKRSKHSINGKSGYYLDRKDNSKGYSIDNVVTCCRDCNRIKGDVLNYEEMVLVMKIISRKRKGLSVQVLF